MKTRFHAVVNRSGFVCASPNAPVLCAGEKRVIIELELPDAAFDDGFLYAKIVVTDTSFLMPSVTARAIDAARACSVTDDGKWPEPPLPDCQLTPDGGCS